MARKPKLPNSCSARAASEHRFDSTKVAIERGQVVNLEFTPTMVVVHDPMLPTPSNPLGVILYSFCFYGVREKMFTPETARLNGQVSLDMIFLLLEIREGQCLYCGKNWGKKLLTEEQQQAHLQEHRIGEV